MTFAVVQQFLIGAVIISAATVVQGIVIGVAERVQARVQRSGRRPGPVQMVALVIGVTLWMLTGQMAGVFVWACAFRILDAFHTFETALYFSLVAYTTLGFGDLLLPEDWRLLGALTASNGLIAFGLATAYMVRFLTAVRAEREY